MDSNHHSRQIRIARAVGQAEAAADATRGLRSDVAVRLNEEDFAKPLIAELEAIGRRQEQIAHDLEGLAFCSNPDAGWGDERYRLAHAGQEPPKVHPAIVEEAEAA